MNWCINKLVLLSLRQDENDVVVIEFRIVPTPVASAEQVLNDLIGTPLTAGVVADLVGASGDLTNFGKNMTGAMEDKNKI